VTKVVFFDGLLLMKEFNDCGGVFDVKKVIFCTKSINFKHGYAIAKFL